MDEPFKSVRTEALEQLIGLHGTDKALKMWREYITVNRLVDNIARGRIAAKQAARAKKPNY